MKNLKRKRARTFEYSEKCVLLDIVTQHVNVIESKKTDGVSIKLKNERWKTIAEEFAASSSTCYRDSQCLKTLWENLKRKAKLAIAAQADNVYGTGGGKAKAILADPIVETVVELIRPHVEPFCNMSDDNADIPTQIITDKSFAISVTDDLKSEKDEEENFMSPVVKSPKVQYKSAGDTKNVQSRKRPLSTTSASQTLLEANIASLNTESGNAGKEHELEVEILQLKKKQEQLKLKQEEKKLKQEEEKLKQEEMKTELLRIQIEKESGAQWVFSNDEGK